jgi:hypothetical protein
MSEMKRFRVTIEREFVVYAPNNLEAEGRAMAHLRKITQEEPATRPIKVVEVEELPLVEPGHGPIVDQAPSRETRA